MPICPQTNPCRFRLPSQQFQETLGSNVVTFLSGDLHSGEIPLDILLYLEKKEQVSIIEICRYIFLKNDYVEFLVNRKSCWRFAYDILPPWKYADTFYCRSKLLCLAYNYFSNIASVEKSSRILIYEIDHRPALSL